MTALISLCLLIQFLLTYQPGKLTEAPGHVDRQHSIVSLLQGDVAEVVGEAAQPLGHAGIAQVEQHIQAQRLEGIQVHVPVGVIKLDAGGVLLVLGQAEHLQVVVTHKVFSLTSQHLAVPNSLVQQAEKF